jgi:hypothetical protein
MHVEGLRNRRWHKALVAYRSQIDEGYTVGVYVGQGGGYG